MLTEQEEELCSILEIWLLVGIDLQNPAYFKMKWQPCGWKRNEDATLLENLWSK